MAAAAKSNLDDVRTIGERGGRDLNTTAGILERWLGERMPSARDIALRDLAWPQGAGMSNETILMRASWRADGRTVERGLAVRIEPHVMTLFKDADLPRQFDLLRSLHDGGHVKVAEPLWFEDDAAVLGHAFYVMRRLEGRVPVSMPPYNRSGFLIDASPQERETLWLSAMEELCRIARVPDAAVGLLTMPDKGATGFDQHLAWSLESCRWAGGEASPFLMQSEDWLLKHRPTNAPSGLSWGDARIGNMMFGADFRLAGVMDWEQASLGGPPQDLGWWLFFDEIHSRHAGLKRLEGLGSRQQTLELWEELTGLSTADIEWYEVFAGYKLVTILARSFGEYRQEQPGHNLNNNFFSRAMAEIMGVDAPGDVFMPDGAAANV